MANELDAKTYNNYIIMATNNFLHVNFLAIGKSVCV